MNKGPAQSIAGLAIAGLIAYMHSKHIWPLDTMQNALWLLLVCIVVFVIASAKGG